MWKEWKSFGRGKCLLGLVGERLPLKTILSSTRRRDMFVESNFCSENCFCTYSQYVVQKMYIYTPPPPSRWRNYLPLFTQAAELDLFFLLLFFFFVPSLPVPFDFPLSSAAARLT